VFPHLECSVDGLLEDQVELARLALDALLVVDRCRDHTRVNSRKNSRENSRENSRNSQQRFVYAYAMYLTRSATLRTFVSARGPAGTAARPSPCGRKTDRNVVSARIQAGGDGTTIAYPWRTESGGET